MHLKAVAWHLTKPQSLLAALLVHMAKAETCQTEDNVTVLHITKWGDELQKAATFHAEAH